MLQRTLPAGFIAPCLPTKTDKLPSGGLWLHEIKHDGIRVIARKDGERVRLFSRPGNDLTRRFPLIVETLARLRSRSCIIDGEAVACDDNGVTLFDLVRHHRANDSVFLYAAPRGNSRARIHVERVDGEGTPRHDIAFKEADHDLTFAVTRRTERRRKIMAAKKKAKTRRSPA